MIIRRPDRCIVSLGTKPKDWPSGWAFPSSVCPPGWPRVQTAEVRETKFAINEVGVVCLNEYGETETALDGEMMMVAATDVRVRVRLGGGKKFCDCALVKIIDGMAVTCGLVFERACHVKAVLYGYEPEKAIEWDWST